MTEPKIVVDGVELTNHQVATIRVAVSTLRMTLEDPLVRTGFENGALLQANCGTLGPMLQHHFERAEK